MNPVDIKLENIDSLIEYWEKECQDLDPKNVDSMDRHVELSYHTAYQAVCLLPQVLRTLKFELLRQRNIDGGGDSK